MPDTYTTNYGFTKPEVGGSRDTWGTKHNSNLDTLDITIKTVETLANSAMPKSGGAFTGAVTSNSAISTTSTFSAAGITNTASLSTVGILSTGNVVVSTTGTIAVNGDGSIEITRAGGAYIDLKNDLLDDYDVRLQQTDGNLNIVTTASGTLKVNGQNVYHTGNFDPATKADLTGATFTGDITTYRSATPTTGAIFLNQAKTRSLAFDGTNYVLAGANLLVNGYTPWTNANFNPANYVAKTGDSMSGILQIVAATPYIDLYDSGWGSRKVYANEGLVGFLNSGGGWAAYSDNAGNFLATANLGAYSDVRHKTDIETFSNALETVEKLRGVRYTRKSSGKREIGLVAQEVQEVIPEVVLETADGLGVAYQNTVAVLIEAVKELAGRVKELEAR